MATVLSDDKATLAGVAASGTAVAVMSQLSIYDNERDDLVALPVAGLPPRIVTLARHREWAPDPAAQGVFDLIVSHVAGRPLHEIVRPRLRSPDAAVRRPVGQAVPAAPLCLDAQLLVRPVPARPRMPMTNRYCCASVDTHGSSAWISRTDLHSAAWLASEGSLSGSEQWR